MPECGCGIVLMHVSTTLACLFYRSSASTETTFASTVGVLSFLPGSISNFVRHASGPRGTPVLDVTSICYRSGVVSVGPLACWPLGNYRYLYLYGPVWLRFTSSRFTKKILLSTKKIPNAIHPLNSDSPK